jgi:hypothetical protein
MKLEKAARGAKPFNHEWTPMDGNGGPLYVGFYKLDYKACVCPGMAIG